MNCAICGKDNQTGTRFCVHCGASLAIPSTLSQQSTIATAGAILGPKAFATTGTDGDTGTQRIGPPPSMVSAPPPSTASPPPPSIASAASTIASAVPLSTIPPVSSTPAYAQSRAMSAPNDFAAAPPPPEPAPAVPAYNAEPKRAGVVVAAICGVGVLALIGYAAMTMFGGASRVNESVTRVDAPTKRVESSPTIAPAPSVPTAEPAPKTEAPIAEKTSPPIGADMQPLPDIAKTQPPKAETKSAAAKAPTPSAPTKSAAVAPIAPTTPAPAAPAAPSTTHATAPAATVASPAATATTDRWTQFADDLRRCQGESFLNRVVCDQRVRLRYCEGYWGRVPQCPGGIANPDRGQ